ncbi:hypothetical protein [Knoellia sp. Soil729]|uniref:hypothetical protein n=1 Tax=Knoellia sp. Soil729 TaxID=1736394 RepID=UPI0006F6B8AC|nr:hypothetical protein [Knoellia sp. Soil729]KRE42721.1 hypothetical protein ASG74_10115 [Knoellia sp. Soil729]
MPTASDLITAIAHGRVTLGRDRLEFLASFDDRVWEVVGGGPQGLRVHQRGDDASLNPQPLPPHEAGRQLMSLMARGIIIVSGRDQSAQNAFFEDVEDWCGTSWPRRWPWLGPGPVPEPDAEHGTERGLRDDFRRSALVGGALAAAEIAARYPSGELRDVFEKAAQRLTEAGLG